MKSTVTILTNNSVEKKINKLLRVAKILVYIDQNISIISPLACSIFNYYNRINEKKLPIVTATK